MPSGNFWRSREGIRIFEGNFALKVLVDLINPLHQFFKEAVFLFYCFHISNHFQGTLFFTRHDARFIFIIKL